MKKKRVFFFVSIGFHVVLFASIAIFFLCFFHKTRLIFSQITRGPQLPALMLGFVSCFMCEQPTFFLHPLRQLVFLLSPEGWHSWRCACSLPASPFFIFFYLFWFISQIGFFLARFCFRSLKNIGLSAPTYYIKLYLFVKVLIYYGCDLSQKHDLDSCCCC